MGPDLILVVWLLPLWADAWLVLGPLVLEQPGSRTPVELLGDVPLKCLS